MSIGTNRIRKLKKLDSSDPEFNVEITRIEDGLDSDRKYVITAERMNDVNWRDDDSISFVKSQDQEPPRSDGGRTILKTTADGRTWLALPDLGEPLELTSAIPCRIQTGGVTVPLFETNTKQNALTREQLDNIEAVPNKADRSLVDNKVDVRAVTYNEGQKAQIRTNIGAASSVQGTKADNAVQFVTQSLSDEEKAAARENIAAASGVQGTKADNAVQFVTQSLSDEEKAAARTNIDAVASSTVSVSPVQDTIVKRKAGGQIALPASPIADTDAASKGYVDTQIANGIDKMYPLGSIYISVNNVNPGTALGVGTWTVFGTGRTIVGVDTSQSYFSTVEKTGGEPKHALTPNEMPRHSHTQDGHSHTTNIGWRGFNTGGSAKAYTYDSPDGGSGHPIYSSGVTPAIHESGGGAEHENLQPYITVYMWKRTG